MLPLRRIECNSRRGGKLGFEFWDKLGWADKYSIDKYSIGTVPDCTTVLYTVVDHVSLSFNARVLLLPCFWPTPPLRN